MQCEDTTKGAVKIVPTVGDRFTLESEELRIMYLTVSNPFGGRRMTDVGPVRIPLGGINFTKVSEAT